MGKKKRSLRNEKLRVNRASETEEQRKERLRIEDKTENEKIENHAVHSQKIEGGEVEEKPKTGEGGC